MINLLIYFDSTDGGAFTIDKNDFDSPYLLDSNGDLYRKNITLNTFDPAKLMSMDEINDSYKQSLVREQLEKEQENNQDILNQYYDDEDDEDDDQM